MLPYWDSHKTPLWMMVGRYGADLVWGEVAEHPMPGFKTTESSPCWADARGPGSPNGIPVWGDSGQVGFLWILH